LRSQPPPHHPRPQAARKEIQRRQPHLKRQRRRGSSPAMADRRAGAAEPLADKGPRLPAPLQPALRHQLPQAFSMVARETPSS
jgi:hypothetical protein